jgi:DNA-binding MarR family transcriptional regulator
MEARYHTLKTIYDIAGDDPQPETYACRPREMILRLFVDWSVIHQHLRILEEEGLITTAQLNTLIVRISREGIEKLHQLTHERASA